MPHPNGTTVSCGFAWRYKRLLLCVSFKLSRGVLQHGVKWFASKDTIRGRFLQQTKKAPEWFIKNTRSITTFRMDEKSAEYATEAIAEWDNSWSVLIPFLQCCTLDKRTRSIEQWVINRPSSAMICAAMTMGMRALGEIVHYPADYLLGLWDRDNVPECKSSHHYQPQASFCQNCLGSQPLLSGPPRLAKGESLSKSWSKSWRPIHLPLTRIFSKFCVEAHSRLPHLGLTSAAPVIFW